MNSKLLPSYQAIIDLLQKGRQLTNIEYKNDQYMTALLTLLLLQTNF